MFNSDKENLFAFLSSFVEQLDYNLININEVALFEYYTIGNNVYNINLSKLMTFGLREGDTLKLCDLEKEIQFSDITRLGVIIDTIQEKKFIFDINVMTMNDTKLLNCNILNIINDQRAAGNYSKLIFGAKTPIKYMEEN